MILLHQEEPDMGTAVKIACLQCGENVVVTEWGVHEGICSGKPCTSSMIADENSVVEIEDSDIEFDNCSRGKPEPLPELSTKAHAGQDKDGGSEFIKQNDVLPK